MSYTIDANLLLYASNRDCDEHEPARQFIEDRGHDPDLLCLAWSTLSAYLRISTHPSIFRNPLAPDQAWANIQALIALPRTRITTEEDDFSDHYQRLAQETIIRGNLVPDAHLAALMHQHGVRKIYTNDTDFRRFSFLEVINPFFSV